MGIPFGLFPKIHLNLNFDSLKLLFICNKLLHNIFLNKHSMHDTNHIQVFALASNTIKIFCSLQ